ncbi:peptidylprolyl isomerase [Paenibacillus caui]|uniref:peptidylprolyl isomerase n=1 Tax=Paenibacillus caui TaxID=2873927 RepID=UPI001CA89F2F|nr:peptidylprolyl isomerase [Paenibacillus caui]
MRKRRKWMYLSLPIFFLGAIFLYAALMYQPLLFAFDDHFFRRDDWERMKPTYFRGIAYSSAEEVKLLEQLSLEELILYKGKQMGVKADENLIEEQLKQLGSTKAEREETLRQMNMTEADSINNIKRAMIGFEVKKIVTRDVAVTQEEVDRFYREQIESFRIPELRTIYYLRVNNGDKHMMDKLKNVSAERFQSLLKQYGDDAEGRTGFYELVSQSYLSSHHNEIIANAVFQSPAKRVVGPLENEQWTYWFLPVEIMPAKTQSLPEVSNKIQQTLYLEKEAAVYQKWLKSQKQANHYLFLSENLHKNKFLAFWSDLPVTFRILFNQ